jgi:hypothetical protein
MLRSIMAVIAGYATMAVLVMVGTIAIIAAFVPGGMNAMRAMRTGTSATLPAPTTRYLIMNLVLSFVAAVLGGWMTSRIATHAVGGHLIALSVVIVLLSVLSAFGRGSNLQPTYYKFVIPLVGVAGVAASTLLTRTA